MLYLIIGVLLVLSLLKYYGKLPKKNANAENEQPKIKITSNSSANRVTPSAVNNSSRGSNSGPKITEIPNSFTQQKYSAKHVSKPVTKSDSKPGTNEQELFISEIKRHSFYFNRLGKEEQRLFLKRAWVFLKTKDFQFRQMLELDFSSRVLISSYAAQITFGFSDVTLAHFKTIVVYPEAYRSPFTGQMHKGEANQLGALVFSLKDLKVGHAIQNDGLNVALHEMAHAVQIENDTPNSEYQFLDSISLRRFSMLADTEMALIRRNSNHFLRQYAATNRSEFFAVCVENFFERSEQMRTQMPQVYDLLVRILMQNPLNSPVRLQPF